jgi:predicted PhzF superfamily epimerase YddE/YHI9
VKPSRRRYRRPVPVTVDVLRVFTRDGEGGNHLGVVSELEELDTAAMQAIAHGLGFSETVFLDPAAVSPFVRIFTPAAELPFAGHPLVGTAWWLAGRGRSEVVLRCGVGPVRSRREAGLTWIDAPSDQRVVPSGLDPPGWPAVVEAWEVRMPLRYHLLRLGSPGEVAELAVPEPPLAEVMAWAWVDPERSVKARFFAPGVGVPEDPATGSAAVALAALLRHTGRPQGELVVLQGDEMGAPSTIHLRWVPSTTSIGGVVVAGGTRAWP